MRQYRGHFEVHLTARTPDAPALARFQQWCSEQQMKCVHIILARGMHAEQPMATWRRSATTLAVVLAEAEQIATDLRRQALPIVRVKIEAAPGNEEIPQRDADAFDQPPDQYFEHHIKLRRPQFAEQASLVQLCEAFGAHLSRNAFHDVPGGMEERFVTLRSVRVGRSSSEKQLQNLLRALQTLGEEILEYESEYCVYDSNLAIDAGWLTHTH